MLTAATFLGRVFASIVREEDIDCWETCADQANANFCKTVSQSVLGYKILA